MKRQNILLGIIIFLVVINSIILLFFLTPFRGAPGHDKIIIERLQFNESQVQQFNQLKKQHHQKIVDLNEETDQLLKMYFSTVGKSNPSDSIVIEFARLESEKVKITYKHFEDLRHICNEDQKKRFDEFSAELLKFILPGNSKRPPRMSHP